MRISDWSSDVCSSDLFRALEAADIDDGVRVIIIRGAGKCFSSGYDLSFERERWPYHTSRGIGLWSRHVVEGCFRIWDLATPVIAQVHRSEEHTSELQSLMRISYAVFCLKNKK